MNTIFGFENLAAYQRAMDLVDKVAVESIARPLSGLRKTLVEG